MGASTVLIGGKLALYVLKALDIHVGFDEKEIGNEYNSLCLEIIKNLISKNVNIEIPGDFTVLEKPNIEH